MQDISKLKQIFVDILELQNIDEVLTLNYRDSGWDSLAHMRLISELENNFDLMLDTDDIVNMSSFEKCIEILGKYDVKFSK